jgi:uncharacterized protein with FMN-binding domain
MPRRALAAVVATVAAVVLLASFRTPDTARTRVAGLPPALGTPTPAPSPSASPSPSPSTTAGSGVKDGRFTGEDVSMRFGDVQVQLVVSGGRITDVQALVLPSDRARSAYISQVAGPILHDEVLQAQSAQIDSLSGATYTSDAYAQSVQAALDRAHG